MEQNYINKQDYSKYLQTVLNSLRINVTDQYEAPKVCLELVEDNGKNSTLATLGNFSLITGKAKSKKSFFIGMAISATTKNGIVLNKFIGNLEPEKSDVLYFDTEQAKEHVQKAVKRICAVSEIDIPTNLHTYGLRKLEPQERLDVIEHAIYSNPKVGFVVIDGIKDLITSINDEEQATMIASKLLKWTEERNIHIVTVLHQNKGDNNARGHVGTELINKAETVLSITKSNENKNVSIVEAVYCRDKEPDLFAFEINEAGIPEIVNDFQNSVSAIQKKVSVFDYPSHDLFKVFMSAFEENCLLSYSELVIQFKIAFYKMMDKSIGDNKAKEFILHAKNKMWIVQDGAKSKYSLGEFITV